MEARKDKLRKKIQEILCRRRAAAQPLSYVFTKLNQVLRGWINYFRIGSMKTWLKNDLGELDGAKAVVPLDAYLGIADLPFKITVSMMLEISYWAAKTGSYQDAEDFLKRTKGVSVSDDTIRKVVNYIGNLVFREDCRLAKECEIALNTAARDASYGGRSDCRKKSFAVFASLPIYHESFLQS